jgi:hypothetical protein
MDSLTRRDSGDVMTRKRLESMHQGPEEDKFD